MHDSVRISSSPGLIRGAFILVGMGLVQKEMKNQQQAQQPGQIQQPANYDGPVS